MGLRSVLVAREHPILARITSGLDIAKEGVEELLWPTRCVLCDVPGTLLCDECRLEIPYIDALHACPYCGQANGRLACIDCNSFIVEHRNLAPEERPSTHGDEGLLPLPEVKTRTLPAQSYSVEGKPNTSPDASLKSILVSDTVPRVLDQIVSVFSFVDPCRKLITTYKDRKELRLAPILADLLANNINPTWIVPGETALVVIPARKEAIRERGFDHMKEVGKELSRRSRLPLLDLLAPNERIDQRGLSAFKRQRNMHNSFMFKYPGKLFEQLVFTQAAHLPERVILVDDVLTTGATLQAAAATLKEAGISHVFGLTVARIP